MEFKIQNLNNKILEQQAISKLMRCNEITKKFGLVLTQEQALKLIQTKSSALKKTGRIELGQGIVDKLIKEFCDSPYISENNYMEILHDLIEIFYFYKNETLDLISDDELIEFMKKKFDGVCQGSIELLSDRELYVLSNNLKNGYSISHEDTFTEDSYNED
ncbi:DUF6323 family protein [Clostridiaceae bacterium M8S5]|nr:DUF6323 family protein [Clostridiaceae bacterium M8S5]